METGLRSVTTLYQGKTIDVTFSITAGQGEIDYLVRHSLVLDPNPPLEGILSTLKEYGMEFAGSRMGAEDGSIIKGLQNPMFRKALLQYILSYVRSNEGEILRMMSTGNMSGLSKIPRVSRPDDIVDQVLTIISQIPRATEGLYLDLLGSGVLGQKLGLVLKDRSVYPLPGPKYGPQDAPSDGSLNLVTSFMSLHHLPDPAQVLRALYHAMVPGGIMVVVDYDYRDQNGMDSFLDAIHGVSDLVKGDDPSRSMTGFYRPRFEWHTMIVGEGFQHMLSPQSNVRLQMETKKPCNEPWTRGKDMDCGAWMVTNPRRLFLSVFRKPPTSEAKMSIVTSAVETKPSEAVTNLGSIFPRRGGRSGTLPPLREGINYDRESLAKAIPWSQAFKISRLILDTVKASYPGKRLSIIISNAGLGTMAMGLLGNPVLNPIQVLESDPKLHQYLMANMALYGSGPLIQIQQEQTLYRVPGPPGQEILVRNPPSTMDVTLASRGGILFLDTNALNAEAVARKALITGTLMVILRMPPGRVVSLPTQPHDIPNIHLVLPSPEIKAATITPEPSIAITVPQDFLELVSLVRDRFPDLLPLAESIIPGVTVEEEESLRLQVQERLSKV